MFFSPVFSAEVEGVDKTYLGMMLRGHGRVVFSSQEMIIEKWSHEIRELKMQFKNKTI